MQCYILFSSNFRMRSRRLTSLHLFKQNVMFLIINSLAVSKSTGSCVCFIRTTFSLVCFIGVLLSSLANLRCQGQLKFYQRFSHFYTSNFWYLRTGVLCHNDNISTPKSKNQIWFYRGTNLIVGYQITIYYIL